jgi:BirA family biotin operon repressor/biotin-[acetyl-CoA-carboxylase] ligase
VSLDLAQLRRAISRPIHYYPTIDSTMNAAARCEPGAIVLAGEQTAGQGRHGHTWHSEAGAGIYCSLVLEPTPLLTLALGLATAEAIANVTGLACDLRWPNDVMLAEKKVAGILVQLADSKAIAGIGINVNHTAFPAELASQSTSLRMHLSGPVAREPLIIELLRSVEALVSQPPETILRLFTHASTYAAGRRVVVQQPDGLIEGVTAGLDPCGFLIVRKNDGTDTLIVAGGVRAAGS